MAQNDHRNLAGFMCGFVLGKLSTVLKWYSVKRKKKCTHKFKMLCLLVFLSWSYAPIKNCWRKKSRWIILPIPPCNLGIICVISYGNLVFQNARDENSLPTWENQDSLGTTFQMLRKEDFSVGTFVLSPFFLGLLAQGAILSTGNWVPRVSVLSKRSDILEWPYLCLKEGINRMVPDYSFFSFLK